MSVSHTCEIPCKLDYHDFSFCCYFRILHPLWTKSIFHWSRHFPQKSYHESFPTESPKRHNHRISLYDLPRGERHKLLWNSPTDTNHTMLMYSRFLRIWVSTAVRFCRYSQIFRVCQRKQQTIRHHKIRSTMVASYRKLVDYWQLDDITIVKDYVP